MARRDRKPAWKTTYAGGVIAGPIVAWLLGRYVGDVPPEAAAAVGGVVAGIAGPLYRKFLDWVE